MADRLGQCGGRRRRRPDRHDRRRDVTGTYVAPEDGWLPVIGSYLFTTFIFGALALNVWEETGWQGMVQRHLLGRTDDATGARLRSMIGAAHPPPTERRGR